MRKYEGKYSRGDVAARPQTPGKKRKKTGGWGSPGFLLLWSVLLLGAGGFGRKFLWDYLAVYEVSRPEYAMDNYLEQLTKESIYDRTSTLTDLIDFNLESEADCRALVLENLEGDLAYVIRPKEGTDTERVYAILCGKKTVGTVTLVQQAEAGFGLKPWAVSGESYDLSYMMGTETLSVTAPKDYTVKVNGVVLDSSYITREDVHFESMEDLYEDYDVPSMVVYEAGPFFVGGQLELLDRQGNPAEEDLDAYLDNCTDEEVAELDAFLDTFVERYVAYGGSNKNTRHNNLSQLLKYIVEDSNLEKRMKSALEGLRYGQSRGDTVVSITRNQCTSVGDGRYYVDITYLVDTVGKEGVVQTTINAQLIILRTGDGLKTEILMNY